MVNIMASCISHLKVKGYAETWWYWPLPAAEEVLLKCSVIIITVTTSKWSNKYTWRKNWWRNSIKITCKLNVKTYKSCRKQKTCYFWNYSTSNNSWIIVKKQYYICIYWRSRDPTKQKKTTVAFLHFYNSQTHYTF